MAMQPGHQGFWASVFIVDGKTTFQFFHNCFGCFWYFCLPPFILQTFGSWRKSHGSWCADPLEHVVSTSNKCSSMLKYPSEFVILQSSWRQLGQINLRSTSVKGSEKIWSTCFSSWNTSVVGNALSFCQTYIRTPLWTG